MKVRVVHIVSLAIAVSTCLASMVKAETTFYGSVRGALQFEDISDSSD